MTTHHLPPTRHPMDRRGDVSIQGRRGARGGRLLHTLTAYYLLPTAYCLLLTTYDLRLTTCYSLLTTYYLLLTTTDHEGGRRQGRRALETLTKVHCYPNHASPTPNPALTLTLTKP
eukprot:scaffold109762_cov42-Phaeocystis_antarctica.AAC.1